MKKFIYNLKIFICCIILIPLTSLADEIITTDCYAMAMIGYDSVVNSRVGLPPETSIHITHNTLPDTHPLSRINLLKIIMGAYLWKDTPHTYAVSAFSACISEPRVK